ncbi:MAG: hypothetical protein ACTTKF_00485 [Bacteroides sp.]
MKNFFELKERQQRILLGQTAVRIGIPVQAYCKIGFVQIDEISPLNPTRPSLSPAGLV